MNPALRALAALAACGASLAHPSAPTDAFSDPEDGRFDMSQWLLDRKGFLPVPIIVTEPAVGYGGGAAALFFHRNESPEGAAGKRTPPDISVVAAFGTENGSKGGALGHLGFTGDRNWRYAGGVGKASLNLTWYGTPEPGGLAFNLDGKFGGADVRRRVPDTDWWVGMRYVGASFTSRFDAGEPAVLASSERNGTTISGLGPVLEFDSRDNIFTPNHGMRLQAQALKFSDALGSARDFTQARLSFQGFWRLAPRVVVGTRADMEGVNGDVPFYARPFIELRGIPVMRYQGDRTAVLEVEARWDLDGRWSAVGFAGAGRAAERGGDLGSSPTRTTLGAGVRYLLARALGLHVGVDVARGPEETAVYLIVGSSWR